MDKTRILIVDDEPDLCHLLEMTLSRMGLLAESAPNLKLAREMLLKNRYGLCLSDLRLPDGKGIELVEFIQQECPGLPVAVITAHGNMETAISALKAGAFDFVNKPIELPMLRKLVEAALKLTAQSEGLVIHQRMIGQSASIRALKATIDKVARSQAPVAIYGASGTGKEMVARLIHDTGPRADKAFVPVNCGAVPEQLLESEFFGHLKGSFTGATENKEGLFQTASGGTLFLDEVAELPLHMQVKLLRVLQEKKVRPVGARKETPVDVRIVSATHRDLHQLVQEGRFRQDLYYRINVIELQVPSLQERREDIPDLVEFLMRKLADEMQVAKPLLDQEALKVLMDYGYPGNVRELENILARAMTLLDGQTIGAADLQLPRSSTIISDNDSREEKEAGGLDTELEDLERRRIMAALQDNRFNKTATARQLGISFRALRYRLKKLGIA